MSSTYKPTSGLTPGGLRRLGAPKAPDAGIPRPEETVTGLTRDGLRRVAGVEVEGKTLNMAQRKALPKSAFVFPERGPGPGSYLYHDRTHAGVALGRAKGTKDYAAVKKAVCSRYPDMPACKGG